MLLLRWCLTSNTIIDFSSTLQTDLPSSFSNNPTAEGLENVALQVLFHSDPLCCCAETLKPLFFASLPRNERLPPPMERAWGKDQSEAGGSVLSSSSTLQHWQGACKTARLPSSCYKGAHGSTPAALSLPASAVSFTFASVIQVPLPVIATVLKTVLEMETHSSVVFSLGWNITAPVQLQPRHKMLVVITPVEVWTLVSSFSSL